jgi:histidinol-phosphate/aromatic aminotransferase/cobyric acid decarboxylase-like protein
MPGMDTSPSKSEQIWNSKLQEYHGGQDWSHLPNLIDDFSVTTNGLGTPQGALAALKASIDTVLSHYPSANNQPALGSLAKFLWPEEWMAQEARVVLGNGASELIDLVVRQAPSGGFKPGPTRVQYKEYERSATSHGRVILPSKSPDPASLFCVVNPTNPTGEYRPIAQMKQMIEQEFDHGGNGVVIVDESMQMWLGAEWRLDSLLMQSEWICAMSRRGVDIYIMHSWTKIWSCTGLRLGSVVCPTAHHAALMKRIQVPWSVNSMAQVFLTSVTLDHEFMRQTWSLTTQWNMAARKAIMEFIQQVGFEWVLEGETFLSWLWIDTRDESIAKRAVESARARGTPIRWGKYGYNMSTHVRIAVRPPAPTRILIDTWLQEFQK